ncbi:MAG: YncE family protein, partial [Rhodobacterales bacterium]
MTLVATQLAAGDFAYVTNQNSQELSILDLDARTETARISIPGKPAGVAVDLKGHVFTVSPDSKVVRRLDAAGTILAAAQLDGGPIGVAYDARQNLIFVSDWYNARIWVMDAETLQTLQVLETGSAPAGLTVSE